MRGRMIVGGLLTVGVASMWMSGLNLGVSPGMVISPRNIQTLGAGLMFVPLNLAAYAFIPKEQTNNASGLFSLVRNEGSSIGVAITNTLLQRRTQFHQNRLIEHLHPLNPAASGWLTRAFRRVSGPRLRPGRRATAGAGDDVSVVQQQAAAVSYLDMFWLFSMLSFAVDPACLPDEAVSVDG